MSTLRAFSGGGPGWLFLGVLPLVAACAVSEQEWSVESLESGDIVEIEIARPVTAATWTVSSEPDVVIPAPWAGGTPGQIRVVQAVRLSSGQIVVGRNGDDRLLHCYASDGEFLYASDSSTRTSPSVPGVRALIRLPLDSLLVADHNRTLRLYDRQGSMFSTWSSEQGGRRVGSPVARLDDGPLRFIVRYTD